MHNKRKIMKKLICLLFIATASLTSMAVKSDGEKVFKLLKAENTETFSMSFSKDMINFFDMDLDFNGKEKLITGDFHKANMLVLNKNKSTNEICSAFINNHYKIVESENDIENSNDSEVFLYIDHQGKNISEAHFVIINEEKVTILSVFGDIKVKNK
jgi:hypothetical protein